MFKKIIYLSIIATAFVSCRLNEGLRAQADKASIFGSEQGIEAYSLSFYSQLPGLSTFPIDEAGVVDYAPCRTINTFYLKDQYTAETSTSWSWSGLRSVNYFIDALHQDVCTVDDKTKEHYEGLARFFRAYFYYEKLTKYGGVPWYDHCLSSDEFDEMYKDRDDRDVIISHIIEDLDYAYTHILTEDSECNTRISKWAAIAFKSRVCLFEASYRKYHDLTKELPAVKNAKYTAKSLYRLAEESAKTVMDSKKFSLNTKTDFEKEHTYGANVSRGAYRYVFYMSDIPTSEAILAVASSAELKTYGEANWRFFSSSYGNGYCGSRAFVHTFLNKDGSRFTDKSGYKITSFKEEFTDRDPRLSQIFICPSYTLKSFSGNMAPDIVNGVASTGYHIIKYVLDDTWYNNKARNVNSMPIIRYAEILLNYAEARAEQGSLTDGDWENTIGAIRSRAGITGGLTAKPGKADAYLTDNFYPGVTDASILEIRRERAIELFYEGYRRNDLNRWACGRTIISLPFTGLHITALDTKININNDKADDYYFTYKTPDEVPASVKSIYVQLFEDSSTEQGLRAHKNSAGGYDLEYVIGSERKWYDDDRQYLYPIPAQIIRDYTARGYTLTQNFGW